MKKYILVIVFCILLISSVFGQGIFDLWFGMSYNDVHNILFKQNFSLVNLLDNKVIYQSNINEYVDGIILFCDERGYLSSWFIRYNPLNSVLTDDIVFQALYALHGPNCYFEEDSVIWYFDNNKTCIIEYYDDYSLNVWYIDQNRKDLLELE